MSRVYMLEKVKAIFCFFISHQKWLIKNIFIENGRILGNFAKGAEVAFDLDGTFWTPTDLQKFEGTLLPTDNKLYSSESSVLRCR